MFFWKAATFESESDTSTIIDEDIEEPAVPDHPEADIVDESSEEVVYNPAFYNQPSKSDTSDSSDIQHQISVLKIRIHGRPLLYFSIRKILTK